MDPTFPIQIDKLIEALPHRGPMVWVDQVLKAGPEGGETLIILDPDKHYFDNKQIRQSSYIEWMAQSYGYVQAAYGAQTGEVPSPDRRVFLVGLRQITFYPIDFKGIERLKICVQRTRQIGPVSFIQGKVLTLGKEIICEGELKLFHDDTHKGVKDV